MSTWFYLECLDHEPPLQAEDESGQHYSDLPQIRRDIRDRPILIPMYSVGWKFEYFRNNTMKFLSKHPECSIGIMDEYGVAHSIEDEND